jgi:hypothetical protein
VLGLPPAFVLSHDQTLKFELIMSASEDALKTTWLYCSHLNLRVLIFDLPGLTQEDANELTVIRMANSKTEKLLINPCGLMRKFEYHRPRHCELESKQPPPRIAVCASLLIIFTISKNRTGITPPKLGRRKNDTRRATQSGAKPNLWRLVMPFCQTVSCRNQVMINKQAFYTASLTGCLRKKIKKE